MPGDPHITVDDLDAILTNYHNRYVLPALRDLCEQINTRNDAVNDAVNMAFVDLVGQLNRLLPSDAPRSIDLGDTNRIEFVLNTNTKPTRRVIERDDQGRATALVET